MTDLSKIKNLINPRKKPDKQFYLDLLDEETQRAYEENHLRAVLVMLKAVYIKKLQLAIKSAQDEKREITLSSDYDAEKYRRVLELNAQIAQTKKKIDGFKCFFEEPYFARMDLCDEQDGYNSYYIGKRGDEGLEIVDWRAPLARKYYQKSVLNFSINQFDYKLILRRALRVKNGKLENMQNEYLSLSEYLTQEEIGGRDSKAVFDPFLRAILSDRKEKREICDIIETIQEKQYEIITAPEDEQFIVQGVAGSGKTMIMLHRLSYLMYNDETINPSSVLVITPSDSFNAFIDELSQILELGKVKTVTSEDYYLRILKNLGIEMKDRIDRSAVTPDEYLKYAYSQRFVDDIDKRLKKIYESVRGVISFEGGEEVVNAVLRASDRQSQNYEAIKNAGLRVRRCVLGEIKEKADGGLYYTKQMRSLFNCVYAVKEFLSESINEERGYFYFYKQLLSFYKSLRFINRGAEKICLAAVQDLKKLYASIEAEINDLKRYKQNVGTDKETLTYADRIEKREQTKKEIDATISRVEAINSDFCYLYDLVSVVKGEEYFLRLGKCDDAVDIARFFFKEIIKNAKIKYGAESDKLCPADPFCLCLLLSRLGCDLTPKYSYVFVDEAQDLSPTEYAVLKYANPSARFNIFGDLKQNITGFRGIADWKELGFSEYELKLNYRNTNEIVGYVSENLGIDMQAIGLGGGEVKIIEAGGINKFFAGKNGLKAVICSGKSYEKYCKKAYNKVRETGRISKTKINLMTVYESKGLEFTAVAVADGDMTVNERYVACTRALKDLALVREKR